MKFRRSLWVVALLGTAVMLLIIFALTLMGPSIGNVFSNVVSALNVTSIAAPSQEAVVPTQQAVIPTTQAVVPTQQAVADSTATRLPPTPPPRTPRPTEESEYADEPTATQAALDVTNLDGSDTGPKPTALPATPTEAHAESMEVAALPLSIVSVSGEIIGNGTLRVFAPESVNYPQTTRVELELRLDNRYITPTPFGQVTAIPVTQITSTPRPGRPTPTERVPIHESTGLDIHQRMGASLTCLATSFTGCDASRDPAAARIIGFDGANWAWIIAPQEDVRGWQDLHLELWTVSRIGDGPEQAQVEWDYAFQIEVNTGAGNQPLTAGIVAAVAAILALIVLAVLALRGWKTTSQTDTQGKPKIKAKVFISYRRQVSWVVARTIHDNLTQRGADVFIDVDDINEGRFEDIIKRNIEGCDYFVLVLSPGTLESEWVVKEAAYALSLDRRIIPVLADGFNLYEHELPATLQGIQSHNAITLTPEFFNAAMDKLAQFIGV